MARRTARSLGWVVLSGVALFTLVAWLTTRGNLAYPPAWVPWALAAVATGAHLGCETAGYRAPKPMTGHPSVRITPLEALRVLTPLASLRMALAELPVIGGFILAFTVTPNSFMTYLIGLVLGVPLIGLHLLAERRILTKVERSLDRQGANSGLTHVLLGHEPR